MEGLIYPLVAAALVAGTFLLLRARAPRAAGPEEDDEPEWLWTLAVQTQDELVMLVPRFHGNERAAAIAAGEEGRRYVLSLAFREGQVVHGNYVHVPYGSPLAARMRMSIGNRLPGRHV